MYKLLVAATAITLSLGCQAVWRIFLLKSRLSTLISSFFLLPPVDTLRGFSVARGLLLSRDASSVMSRLVLRSNILKKLLYEPVMMALTGQSGGGGGYGGEGLGQSSVNDDVYVSTNIV